MEHTQPNRDPYGPEYKIRVYDPFLAMEGFLVIDNLALGPGKGGIRMTAGVTLEEVERLARIMTWKNALAGIPFGGAKAGVVWPGGDEETKKRFVQSFARKIAPFMPRKYIAGPDVNSGEREMQWFAEATGKWNTATGKPANFCSPDGKKCGLPHELGSTGFGVAHATRIAAEIAQIPLHDGTVAIHGFGNVATFAWRHLTEMGARVVALADRSAVLYQERGLEPSHIERLIREDRKLAEYPGAKKITPEEFWALAVDILIPASVTDVINEGNKSSLRAKMIVEAGNIPMREDVEAELFRRGIIIVPDFVANAGGVISSYAEYRGYDASRMFRLVEQKTVSATRNVMKRALGENRNPRTVARERAEERVREAMQNRSKF